MRELSKHFGCSGVVPGGLEVQGLGEGLPGVLTGWTMSPNWEESLEPVCLRGRAVPQALLHASDKRESRLGGQRHN